MKLKRLIALTISAGMVLSSANVFAADNNVEKKAVFTDVDETNETGKAIIKMYECGYLKGYSDGSFKPDGNITRAELTRVFNQVFGYKADDEKLAKVKDFTDNTEKEAWYYEDVRIAQSNGYINGFEDGSFRPQDNFTRQQTCAVITLAAGLQNTTADIQISDEVAPWASKYVKAVLANGAMSLESENKFRATANITRGEVCKALAGFIKIESGVAVDEKGEVITNADGETQTTTKITTVVDNNNSGSSSTSGGGGGGSSSSNNSSNTTVTTTEATTETTTIATTTEETTEATTAIVLSDAERRALRNVITDTQNLLIPNSSNAARPIAELVLSALKSYYEDASYDFLPDIQEARSMYNALSAEEKSAFKMVAYSTYGVTDINVLQPIFGPLLGL